MTHYRCDLVEPVDFLFSNVLYSNDCCCFVHFTNFAALLQFVNASKVIKIISNRNKEQLLWFARELGLYVNFQYFERFCHL